MTYEELLEKLGLLHKPVRCFERVTREEPVLNRRDRGVMPVPVEQIVGTVSRCRDIGGDFQPRRDGSLPRLERIREAMERGEIMPSLELYRLRDEYYVVDGHHRVAVAKEMGVVYLDAHVVEFLSPADTPANALAHARSNFEVATGLYRIELTEPVGYTTLLAHIMEHQSRLAEIEGQPVSLTDAARDWYHEVYLAIVSEIKRELTEDAASHQFPGKTVGDLYLLLAEYKWLESERQGQDIGLHQAMLDLQLATEGRSWFREIVETVVPCRLWGGCPFAERAEDAYAES